MTSQPADDVVELYYEAREEALRLNGVVQDAVDTLRFVKDRMDGAVYDELTQALEDRATTGADGQPLDARRDVHQMFGLTYSNYLVLNRTLLQNMPHWWQHRLVRMIEQLERAFAHVDTSKAFEVTAGTYVYLTELTDAQRAATGVSSSLEEWDKENPEPDPNGDEAAYQAWEEARDDADQDLEWFDRDGRVINGYAFVPGSDPVEHYRCAAPVEPLPFLGMGPELTKPR